MTNFNAKLLDVAQKDGRYAYEAYAFLFQSLGHTQRLLGREVPATGEVAEARHHVTRPELLMGVRSLALQEFGLMARVVFRMWGVNKTEDFGSMVFNLVEAQLMTKTD